VKWQSNLITLSSLKDSPQRWLSFQSAPALSYRSRLAMPMGAREGGLCTPSRPGDRIAKFVVGDSHFSHFGLFRIELRRANRGQQDFAVLNVNVVEVGLTDYLDIGIGQSDLVFAPKLGQSGIPRK